MSFSGGVYTLPGPALVTGEVVSATENNTFRNDVATAFNLTFLRNGTATATANLPMGGYKLTGLGVATTNGDALSYGNAAVVSNLTNTALTSGRVNYNGVGGILTDSANLTFNGTTLTAAGFSGPLSGNVTGDVTGNVSGNAGTVTNGVYTTGDQTIGGNKTFSSNPILSSGTANGVSYLNGSKVVTTGSALTFDGTTLTCSSVSSNNGTIQQIKTATFNSQTTIATTTGSITVDWTTAQNQKQTEPTGTITYTFTAPPGPCHLQLVIDSDGTSTAQTINWPGTVTWLGTTWAGANNKKAVINFWYDGTNYFAIGSNQV